MSKKLIIICAAFLLATSAFGQSFSRTGTAGAQFLKIGMGARYHGLGEASSATADDIYAMYWNPAGLTYIKNSELAFSYVNYVTDISLNYVAYARQFAGWGTFGVSATVLSMNEQEITTVMQPDGTGEFYDASSYSFQLSYAKQLTAQFSFGLSFKYVGEKIYRESAGGFGFDFGTLLYTGFESLRLGMSITNMGAEMKFDGPDLDVGYVDNQNNPNQDPFASRLKVDPYDLPLTFRFGMAYDWYLSDETRITAAAEVKHPNDNLQQGGIGTEFAWKEHYFLRAGYKLNYEEEGLGLGGGLRTNISGETDLVLDYAWVDYGRLESVHRFSASVVF